MTPDAPLVPPPATPDSIVPMARPASSSVNRSRLRRSRPPGGGAGGRDLTGATTHTSSAPAGESAATQSEPTGTGTCQRRSVVSRSNGGGAPGGGGAGGVGWVGPGTFHRG